MCVLKRPYIHPLATTINDRFKKTSPATSQCSGLDEINMADGYTAHTRPHEKRQPRALYLHRYTQIRVQDTLRDTHRFAFRTHRVTQPLQTHHGYIKCVFVDIKRYLEEAHLPVPC